MGSVQNVLQSGTELKYSDYQNYELAKAYNQLYSMTETANNQAEINKKEKRVYNLSLNDLYQNFFTVITNVLNDVVSWLSKGDKNINDLIEIFIKEDRLMYMGMLLVLISFLMHFGLTSE